MADAYNWLSATALNAPPPLSLTLTQERLCLLLHQGRSTSQNTDPDSRAPEREREREIQLLLDETLSEREEKKQRNKERSSLPPTMPPSAITTKLLPLLLLLLLLLLLHQGGHCLKSLDMAMEMEMDSEAHGRMLWESSSSNSRRYISYDALRSDVVPCSRQGVPYYNCRIMTTANPYTRGCETITRCRDVDP